MLNFNQILEKESSLDPQDWQGMRNLAKRMVDDMFDYLEHVEAKAVWKKTPVNVITHLSQPIPHEPQAPEAVYDEFKDYIMPYNKGNVHPRFWGWVIGTGTPFGMMAEMLAAGMNPDICMGGHAPMYVEEQVINWLKSMLGFTKEASGILLSGTSTANLTGLLVARDTFTDQVVRERGLKEYAGKLLLYTSEETHSCIRKAADIIGIGLNAVRTIPVDKDYRMDTIALEDAITKDKADGFAPFCVVANVGTVNTGAIDPIAEISTIARRHQLWLHIDGAFGALAALVPEYNSLLNDLSMADSIGFDLHKWMSLPIGVGCLLVKDRVAHRRAFSIYPDYLATHERGMVSGVDPTFNYGIEMTKNFRALRVWMCIKEHGIDKFAAVIRQNIAQAFYLESLVKSHSDELELMSPVSLNIVCFRYNPQGRMNRDKLDKLNREILLQIQETGKAGISHTVLNGKFVLRVANINHRSKKIDFDYLLDNVLQIGRSSKSTIFN